MIWYIVAAPLLSKTIILSVIYYYNLLSAAELWDLRALPNGREIQYNEIFKVLAVLFL